MIRRTSIDARLKVVEGQIKADADFVTVNDFTEASAKQFAVDVAKIVDNGQEVLPVVIDSYGGDIYALLAMLDVLDHCGMPVLTYASGKAMSCGCDLLAAGGTKGLRFAAPSATIMMHDGATFAQGKAIDIKANVLELERLEALCYAKLDAKSGKGRGYYKRLLKKAERVDMYFSPAEAKRHGLVDHIAVPSLVVEVSCKVTVAASGQPVKP